MGVLGIRCGTLFLLLVGGELGLCLVFHSLSLPFLLLSVFPSLLFLALPGISEYIGGRIGCRVVSWAGTRLEKLPCCKRWEYETGAGGEGKQEVKGCETD